MLKGSLCLIFVLCFVEFVLCSKPTLKLKKCKRGKDLDKCLAESIRAALPHSQDGFPEIDFPQVDPLAIDFLKIQVGIDGKNLRLHLTNTSCYGLAGSNITAVETTVDHKALTLIIRLFVPKIKLEGNYNLKGKLAGRVGSGSGNYSFNFEDVNATLTFHGKIRGKKDKNYMVIQDTDVFYTANKSILYLENIFEGDVKMSNEYNQHLNKNWLQTHEELQPSYMASLKRVYKDLANRLFETVPHDEIMLPE